MKTYFHRHIAAMSRKMKCSPKAAVRQIREKGYADAYRGGRRRVTVIGINFNSKKRNIDEPIIEIL